MVGGGPAEVGGDVDGAAGSLELDLPDATGGSGVVGYWFVVDLDGEGALSGACPGGGPGGVGAAGGCAVDAGTTAAAACDRRVAARALRR